MGVLIARFWCGFGLCDFDTGFGCAILVRVLVARFWCGLWLCDFGAGFGYTSLVRVLVTLVWCGFDCAILVRW